MMQKVAAELSASAPGSLLRHVHGGQRNGHEMDGSQQLTMVIFSFKGVLVYLPGASVMARCLMLNSELPLVARYYLCLSTLQCLMSKRLQPIFFVGRFVGGLALRSEFRA